MTLAEDIRNKAASTFKDQWTKRNGLVVPDPSDVGHGNDAVEFERATILYADLDQSTNLVDTKTWGFAAEIYKTYLYAASRLIRNHGGDIVSYDGDRVMGVFLGSSQTSNAAFCGLKINYAVKHIIQPELKEKYPSSTYQIRHVVGIDTSEIRAARTGVRGDNDLVWVGAAANYAAKLTALSSAYPTWITGRAYQYVSEERRFGGNPRRLMWEATTWAEMNNMSIYRSTWWWSV